MRLVREYALIVHLLDRSMCAAIGMKYGQEVVEELAIEEWRGASPDLRRPAPPDHGHRGRRRRGDLQGAAARPRLPAALHGRALRDRRRPPRVLRARVLRGAHGRRAVGRAGHHRHVPHDRGRHLRSHRPGREPEGAHHATSTGRRACRPTACRTAAGRSRSTTPTRRCEEPPITTMTRGTTAATFQFPPMRDGTPHLPPSATAVADRVATRCDAPGREPRAVGDGDVAGLGRRAGRLHPVLRAAPAPPRRRHQGPRRRRHRRPGARPRGGRRGGEPAGGPRRPRGRAASPSTCSPCATWRASTRRWRGSPTRWARRWEPIGARRRSPNPPGGPGCRSGSGRGWPSASPPTGRPCSGPSGIANVAAADGAYPEVDPVAAHERGTDLVIAPERAVPVRRAPPRRAGGGGRRRALRRRPRPALVGRAHARRPRSARASCSADQARSALAISVSTWLFILAPLGQPA